MIRSQLIPRIARYYNTTPELILSSTRTASIMTARHVAMYICRHVYGMGFKQIGHAFNRDHSTVVYGVDKIRHTNDPELKQQLEILISDLKSADNSVDSPATAQKMTRA